MGEGLLDLAGQSPPGGRERRLTAADVGELADSHAPPGNSIVAAEQPLGRAAAREEGAVGASREKRRADLFRPRFDVAAARIGLGRRPSAPPRKPSCKRTAAQSGLRGRQIVAPMSISACAKSPGRSAGVSARRRRRRSRAAAGGDRRLEGEQPRQDARDIAVDRRGRPSKAIAATAAAV